MNNHEATEIAYKNGYEAGKPKWIPVTERLPNGRYDVLVSRTWWNERKTPTIGWYNEVAKKWYIITEDGYRVNDKVTHWMPLPEPPKED